MIFFNPDLIEKSDPCNLPQSQPQPLPILNPNPNSITPGLVTPRPNSNL